MKRRDLVRTLLDCGALFLREGGDHTLYVNPRSGEEIVVPRHRELSEYLARSLVRLACEDKKR